jgi:phosphohistidine phosphatase SixA
LSKKDIDVLYVDELYTLADDNYLQHLKAMLNHNEPERVMIVGHNPAMELLLNEVTPATKQTFLPGQFYEICFPGLGSWSDLEQAVKEQRLGAVSFVLPHAKK